MRSVEGTVEATAPEILYAFGNACVNDPALLWGVLIGQAGMCSIIF